MRNFKLPLDIKQRIHLTMNYLITHVRFTKKKKDQICGTGTNEVNVYNTTPNAANIAKSCTGEDIKFIHSKYVNRASTFS